MPRTTRRSLIVRRPGSLAWYCDFQVNGRRFRECLETHSRAEAETKAAQLYADARAGRDGGSKGLTLGQALGRYWEARGHRAKSALDIERHSKTLIAELGNETAIARLSTRAIEDYVIRRGARLVHRRGAVKPVELPRANASINREIGHLRTVLIAAAASGEIVPKIDWRRLFLAEPDKVQTILSTDQEEALFAALRPDFWPLVDFALSTGVRLENAVGLEWSQIDWAARTITFRTKSKKPGGALHILPMTEDVAALVGPLRGHHETRVFTYVCARNRHDPHSGLIQNKGERYGFTHDGWRRSWMRACAAIGLPQLRFHDLRHTAATRALYVHRNIKTVQRMLGHADISTTLRYTASDVTDVRAAMDSVASQFRRKPRLVAGKTSNDGGV